MTCPCGEPFTGCTPEVQSLVGYRSPPGHDHDDNCRQRGYVCGDGHVTWISRRNRCTAPGCDWQGRAMCFCHPGAKVAEWPDAPLLELADALTTLGRLP